MKPSISIITATLNVSAVVRNLAADLSAQSDQDFEWIVVDGGSADNTTDHIREVFNGHLVLVQEPDFGIYDALNKGLRRCKSDYYLVIGADDRLEGDAVATYRRLAANSNADIVAVSSREGIGGDVRVPGSGPAWRRGHQAYIGHHSVDTLIRRSLHERFGFYSRMLPIAADSLFIKKSIQGGAILHQEPDFIAGDYSVGGISNTQFTATMFQFAQVQLLTEKHRGIQYILFLCRLLWNWRRIVN